MSLDIEQRIVAQAQSRAAANGLGGKPHDSALPGWLLNGLGGVVNMLEGAHRGGLVLTEEAAIQLAADARRLAEIAHRQIAKLDAKQ